MIYKMKLVLNIFLIAFGVFLFFFGGYDDSPGAQGLGLLLCIIGIVIIVRSRKQAAPSDSQ